MNYIFTLHHMQNDFPRNTINEDNGSDNVKWICRIHDPTQLKLYCLLKRDVFFR
jgi:hypothetical protein